MSKERPASTDMADVTKVPEAAPHHAEGAHPTAGPSEDDRFGAGPVARDFHTRVVKVDVIGGRTRITIAGGTARGVHVAMEGYVIDKNGTTHELQIEDSSAGMAHATIDGPVEELEGGGGTVVINPSAKPAATKHAKQDVHGRVLKNDIVDGKTLITIGLGADQGIVVGMRGYLVRPGGSKIVSFEVTEVDGGRISKAFVEATLDEVGGSDGVLLNPSH